LITKMLRTSPLMYFATYPKSIAPSVNGNKNVQTIRYFLTQTHQRTPILVH
jgi:hypothetical protein